MGDYTGIRFKGYVKEEFRKGFKIIALDGEWENHSDPILKKFGEIRRSRFIPRGALCYMPESWENESEEATEGFEINYDSQSGYWTFQCSLKNYEREIQKWFEILPYFIESIEHLEVFYEGCNFSQQYDLVDNKVVLVDYSFKDYSRE